MRKKQPLKGSTTLKGSIRIRWSESVTLFQYAESDHPYLQEEMITVQAIEKLDPSKTGKTSFLSEADAIISQLRKKQDQHTSHLEKLLPKLAKHQWSHLSLHELGEIETEILEEMDSFQPIDATIGGSKRSLEYNNTEKQFRILLEAQECLFKLRCVDSQLHSIMQPCKKVPSIKRNRRFRMQWLIPFNNCTSFDLETDSEK